MGKKKDKHKNGHGQDRAGDQPFQVPPQVAGIAAMVLGQVNSPAGRAMIAGALHNAADAIAGRDARAAVPVPPAAPVSPVTPEPPVPPETRAAYTPDVETPAFTLPPEATRAIGAAASALERWAQGLGKPKPPVG